MIDWDQWRTLLAIFRHGTYAGAAKALRIDSTTVSRRLSLLEKRLGYALFLRDRGDRLYPTRPCEALLAHIEVAAESLREAERESAGVEQGAVWRELRMTAPPFLVTNLFAPGIGRLADAHRIRIELMGTASRVGLPRRDVDIAVRIEDRLDDMETGDGRIAAERIGMLDYAVYAAGERDPEALPWAGLTEQYERSEGGRVMRALAGADGFRFQAYHFDTLKEIVAAGVARSMLPCVLGDGHPDLRRAGDTVLAQPLWLLYHRQDRAVPHIKAARSWIAGLLQDRGISAGGHSP